MKEKNTEMDTLRTNAVPVVKSESVPVAHPLDFHFVTDFNIPLAEPKVSFEMKTTSSLLVVYDYSRTI